MSPMWRKLAVEEVAVIGQLGSVEKAYRVRFMVTDPAGGEYGPFSEDFRSADFIPENVRTRLTERAKAVLAI